MPNPYVSRRDNVRTGSRRKSDRYHRDPSDSDGYEEPRRIEKNRKQRRLEKRTDADGGDDDYYRYSAEYPEAKGRLTKKSTRHRKNTPNDDQSSDKEFGPPKKRERKISSDRRSKNGVKKDYEEDVLVGEKSKKRRPTTSRRQKSGRNALEEEWGATKESRKNEPTYYGGWSRDDSGRADQWESGRKSSKESYERRRKNKIDKIRKRKEKTDRKKEDQEEDLSYEPNNKAVWVSLQ